MAGDLNKISKEDVVLFAEHIGLNNLMDLYQHIATQTAIYPGVGTALGLVYVALKGAGEAGEFAEHVGKAMRDDQLMLGLKVDALGKATNSQVPLTPERKEALIKEIGDQLWYLSAKCNELGISLSQAALTNLQKLHDRSNRGTLSGSGDNR
jgi:NTP pyrophosphatase (non-canonical NTP hydrolase)